MQSEENTIFVLGTEFHVSCIMSLDNYFNGHIWETSRTQSDVKSILKILASKRNSIITI